MAGSRPQVHGWSRKVKMQLNSSRNFPIGDLSRSRRCPREKKRNDLIYDDHGEGKEPTYLV